MALSHKLGWAGLAVGVAGILTTVFVAFADPSWVPEAWRSLIAIGGGVLAAAVLLCAVAILTWDLWSRRFPGRRGRRQRRVWSEIRDYIDELDQLYLQSKGSPSEDLWTKAHRVRERANSVLVPWKRRVLEHLDSTIGHRSAREFWCLGDSRSDGNAIERFQASYEVHREHLERIAAEVELGEIRVKWPPQRSGEPLPPVEDFVVKPPPCR